MTAQGIVIDCERFFCSEYFYHLTGLDGKEFLKRLRLQKLDVQRRGHVRKSDEIKKGLRICTVGCNKDCPYMCCSEDYSCQEVIVSDALALIEQLEAQLAKRDNLIDVLED